MSIELTDENFVEKLNSTDKLFLIDFWAEWCGPCRAIGPIIDKLSEFYQDKIIVAKVNVDKNIRLSVEYGITGIPAVLFIKDGKVVDKLIGANTSKTYEKKIESLL